MHDVQEEPDLMELEALLEDGELPAELRVRLTDDALAEALKLQVSDPAHKDLPLRVYIEGKGCDGFYYGVTFAPEIQGDVTFTQGNLKVIVDRPALRFLLGATVTWVDDERGRGFLVDNPRHKRYRGKFYKKKVWLDVFTAPSSRSEASSPEPKP